MTNAVELLPLRGPLDGDLALPGDKSISHRAFLLNSLGSGSARVRGANRGADVESSIRCLRALGVRIVAEADGYRVEGRGGNLRCPAAVLDCGNSGTTLRLLAGILAAQDFTATLDGDESLRGRPMARIARPLRRMGARIEGPDNGEHPPLIVTGGRIVDSEFELAIASAQLKSCLLLAAAAAGSALRLREPGRSRDHSERMLDAMGASIDRDGDWIRLAAGTRLRCVDVEVPGDPSALALLAAALCAMPNSRARVKGVLLNPTRTGFLKSLERSGFEIGISGERTHCGEAVGDLSLRSPERLLPLELTAAEMPGVIDEIPALAVVAAQAEGRSHFEGVQELRVKESDRVASIESLLRKFGVSCGSDETSLWVAGGPLALPARVDAGADHRMVMAAVALGLSAATQAGGSVTLTDLAPASVSFPGYGEALQALGAELG